MGFQQMHLVLQAGVNATVMALYGVADQAPQVTAAQLAVGAIVTPAPDADLRVSARSTVEVCTCGSFPHHTGSRCPSAEMQSAMLHLQRRIAGPMQSSCTNLVQVSTPGGRKLPAAVDVQTALLLGLAEAAAKAKLATKMLAFNVTRWERPSSGYDGCVHMQDAALPLEARTSA